jgi:hypothetical protein
MGRRPPRVTALSVRCDPAGDAGTVPLSGEPATGGATAMGVRTRAGSLITTSLWKVQLEPFCDLPEDPLAIPAAAGDARRLLPGTMFHRAAPTSATAACNPRTTRPAASPGGTQFITFATPVNPLRIPDVEYQRGLIRQIVTQVISRTFRTCKNRGGIARIVCCASDIAGVAPEAMSQAKGLRPFASGARTW